MGRGHAGRGHIGFNDKTWLDANGHPHSESLRLTERFHRVDFGHLELQITIDDPKAFTKPFTVIKHPQLRADYEMLEYFCNENERDSRHNGWQMISAKEY